MKSTGLEAQTSLALGRVRAGEVNKHEEAGSLTLE